ncbi:MAG: hypothetical protein HZY73_00015 [Micropruina sp.]|nr:MAG: hypothetical protein HZY73_00015 [Micropruina sp.]
MSGAANLMIRWGLAVDGPSRRGWMSTVWPVRTRDGRRLVLKLLDAHHPATGEDLALRAWAADETTAGRVVRLETGEGHTLLLERLDADRPLEHHPTPRRRTRRSGTSSPPSPPSSPRRRSRGRAPRPTGSPRPSAIGRRPGSSRPTGSTAPCGRWRRRRTATGCCTGICTTSTCCAIWRTGVGRHRPAAEGRRRSGTSWRRCATGGRTSPPIPTGCCASGCTGCAPGGLDEDLAAALAQAVAVDNVLHLVPAQPDHLLLPPYLVLAGW